MIQPVRVNASIVVGLVLGALSGPLPAAAQNSEPLINTVTVSAFKEVDVKPDIGTVSFGVAVHSLTADGATTKLTKRTARVIDALKDAGFSSDEIDTYNIELVRTCLDRCRDPNPDDNRVPDRVIGYRGSAGVRVETTQLKRLGEVIDVGIGAGANSVRGVTFDVSDRSEAVKEALRQAFVFASDKARVLAEAGGRQLGPALIISEGRTQAPEQYQVANPSVAYAAGASIAGRAPRQKNPFPIEPPTLTASARVQVTFELI